MKATTPRTVLLRDYRPPSHLIPSIDLTFELSDEHTIVSTKMMLEQNPAAGDMAHPLVLNGEELKLLSIKLDGKELSPDDYQLEAHTLTLPTVPKRFTLEIQTEINPQANTALDGLYKSGTIFCTQNEPEGFRRITYFLDRSDIMSKYTTKVIADAKLYPVLLSNGNPLDHGNLADGRHWVLWQDPFPKPCYLFALVAGDLGSIRDTFVTCTGRTIDLRIYCEKGNESRCHHAMRSLQKSMKWDEDVFGLEYDLDIFMIVAVESFNMGAMENKGLNIFNTSCVLADDKSATDDNYARVEGVVAHEYFHNWTGNRVTCRDWFQLTLKEGLTVFRDQEFSSDMNSRAVERIDAVKALRSRQFDEDAGPTAHPIQPQSYIEINNFYTSTVYNKGAEVIRMIQTLIGKEAFRQGIDKYFELYDGQAVTTEDFVRAMEIASGRDLTQFRRWYHQAGTPRVSVTYQYDAIAKTFAITCEQSCAPTADGSAKEPFVIPLETGLLGPDGRNMLPEGSKVLELTESQQTFTFENITAQPVPSINRGFSAPIKLSASLPNENLMFLMAHDSDAFNRWEAGQELGIRLMLGMLSGLDEGDDPFLDPGYLEAYGILLNDNKVDRALKALAMMPPSEDALAQRQEIIDYDGNHLIREYIIQQVALTHSDKLWSIYNELNVAEPYRYEPEAVGRRELKNACLKLLTRTGEQSVVEQCAKQYWDANNMTDRFTALHMLADLDCPERQQTLKHFYEEWKHDAFVITKWLSVQGASTLDGVMKNILQLEKDPVFDIKVPNLVRALYGSFIGNHIHFNVNTGEGYSLIADRVIQLDKVNPQIAAGLAGGFKKFDKMDSLRKKAMRVQLERIIATPNLSQNVYEIVSKILNSPAVVQAS
ncbi:MAG: aminopeptidase N [Chlamydiales bacterium]|nr:aminopeptidase N [Chlamydiales bacterium]